MGADPIAVSTAIVAASSGRDLASFSIRKEAKDHGTGGRLVGPVSAGDLVVVVEDTTTTGSAVAEATTVLLDAGVHVVLGVALVDRSGGKATDRMAELGVPYTALITPDELGVRD